MTSPGSAEPTPATIRSDGIDRQAGVLPSPRFDHLERMTDRTGLWEHARYSTPRTEHGYCTDDNARALIVTSRQPDPSPDVVELGEIYLAFVRDAQRADGSFVNRRHSSGRWSERVGSDDSQGRAVWAVGSAARFAPKPSMREAALEVFCRSRFESPSPRANAFSVLGAAEVLAFAPDNRHARQVMDQALRHLRVHDDPSWPWPEARLAYDNARIPEALLAAGESLANEQLLDGGLRLLDWLVDVEIGDDQFSFTPAQGWALNEQRPAFDQQPVEAAAMADACSRAWQVTRDVRWQDHVQRAAEWFVGRNDIGAELYDQETGGCADGLMHDGINENRGAESTLAALAVLQRAATVD